MFEHKNVLINPLNHKVETYKVLNTSILKLRSTYYNFIFTALQKTCGSCVTALDGYYVESVICVLIGFGWWFFLGPKLKNYRMKDHLHGNAKETSNAFTTGHSRKVT